jgi:hypothetical protein
MIRAMGVSQNPFDPMDPGRLCRGRERWIDPWEDPGTSLASGSLRAPLAEPPMLSRLVISGAEFTDDSARDARRGVAFSGLDLATVIAALFPRKTLLAFMEDGHPADIPDGAEGLEAYTGWRAGGRNQEARVRWHRRVSGVREIRAVLGARTADEALPAEEDAAERVRGFAVLDGEVDEAELVDRLFLFVGMSTLDSPPARYQPAALPEVLELCRAVIVLHRDKHGASLGVYSREPIKTDGRLEALCDKGGVLLVPFAIPPMLARWDRALHELRDQWTRDEPFPVPPAPFQGGWDRRRRRRDDDDVVPVEEELPPVEDAPVAAEGGEE